jgi:hypothetical protein
LGNWLVWEWYICKDKKADAESKPKELRIPEDVLSAKWSKQIAEQGCYL